MGKKLAGPLANSPRDEQDSFVGAPPEKLPVGNVPRWPPNPRKITTNTFHAKVSGEASKARADRTPSFRRGGFVSRK